MTHFKAFLAAHKKAALVFAVLLVAAAFLFAVRPAMAAGATAAEPVQTFSLEKGSIATSLAVNGTVEPAVSATVTGKQSYAIREVAVKVGDTVAKGDVLAILDTTDLDGRIASASAALTASANQLQAGVDQAARRLQDAKNKKDIDDENIDESYAELKKNNDTIPLEQQHSWAATRRANSIAIEDAEAALTNALLSQQSVDDSSLRQLSAERKACTITAPMGGIVTSVPAQVGSLPGTIAVIEDQSSCIVKANIKEYDINRVQPGQAVEVTSGAGDKCGGSILNIAPRAETVNNTVVYPIEILLEGDISALHLGMSAKAKIALEQKDDVFVVPLDAVGTSADGGAVVYALQPDGSFLPVPVITGLENDFETEISGEGLTEGMELQSLAALPDAAMEG